MNKLITFTFGLIFLTACTAQNKKTDIDIKDYYFPYSEFAKQKTYCYVNINDTTEKSYWVMQIKIEGNDTLFCTSILDTKKQKSEELTERVSDHGTGIKKYTLFKPEENRFTAECKIIESSVFNWKMYQGETISWKVEFPEFESKQIIELTKNRTFADIDKITNTVSFKDNMFVVLKGSDQKFEYQVETLYKKNIGLISYKIIRANAKTKDFRLIEE
jgi:hypothetical protein